jgi:crotonobetainyl-CoA:carnitine CoA-transferase CaiB-like acyl-CoA transferase
VRFKNLLVIETGPGLAGPLVTRTLGDLGARVLKIESATKLDFGKARLPPAGKTAEDALEAPAVLEMCGGKESVTLNLKTEVGRELFLKLISIADVYVESYAPGWLERIGLSLNQFVTLNPRLVVLSQSAYGGEGPLSDQRAYAPLMTALAGVESTIGYEDGRIVPQIASAVGDVVAAYFGNLLVLASLYERERTGRGSIIDMSQTEASAALAGVAYAEYGITRTVPLPCGNTSPSASPHGIYPTAGDDDWIAIATYSDEEWVRLCSAISISQDDQSRFSTVTQRLRANAEVDKLVGSRTILEKRDSLFERLQALGIAATPVLNIFEAEDFPALVARPLWMAHQHPRLGEIKMTEIPWRFETIDIRHRSWAEPIGTSTDRTLKDLLGVTDNQLKEWHETAVLT